MREQHTSRLKGLLRTISINMLIMVVALSGFELYFRHFRPRATYSRILEFFSAEQYVSGGFIPFTLKNNYRSRYPSMEYPGQYVPVSTNNFGLRGKDITRRKPEQTKRIMIIGD